MVAQCKLTAAMNNKYKLYTRFTRANLSTIQLTTTKNLVSMTVYRQTLTADNFLFYRH